MQDILLAKLFEQERWEKTLEKAVSEKQMDKTDMRALCNPMVRAKLYLKIQVGSYEIAPPHIQKIPKDTQGEFREVYINENLDRVFLSIVNDMLFELLSDMIHPQCKSYQSGIGCGKVVQEAVRTISKASKTTFGIKLDLSKYFDSVSIEQIDKVFDNIEQRLGKSKVLDVVRKYYHSDLCFDSEGNLCSRFQSLKQGCAVASFLADAILYDLDKVLNKRAKSQNGYYCRYSDDILYITPDYEVVLQLITEVLATYGLKLNPKKVEILDKNQWFKFLGFEIKGDKISLSKSRVKKFQKEIEARTIKAKNKNLSMEQVTRKVNRYLYDGQYSWAKGVLPILTCNEDIETLNEFVMDSIRASVTHKTKIGGLGCQKENSNCFIVRGTGKNVTSNRNKTPQKLEHYLSLNAARNAMISSNEAYETLIRCL